MQTSGILWRIDDRLIHGQVIIGWCGHLAINRLVVCDNEIAATEWEKNLLLMAAPPNLPTEIYSTEDILNRIAGWEKQKLLTMILLKSPYFIRDLITRGIHIDQVNIGGIHYQEGRQEYLSYLYLSQDEDAVFRELIQQGITFECRDLPTSNSYDLKKVLDKKTW